MKQTGCSIWALVSKPTLHDIKAKLVELIVRDLYTNWENIVFRALAYNAQGYIKRHELEDGKNDVVIANSDVVSGLAYRPVAVEDVKQAVLTLGRKREYICRKKLMLFRQN